MEHFKAGDLVEHKTGGPKMVVTGTDTGLNGVVTLLCEYMSKGEIVREAFVPEALQPWVPAKPIRY